MTKSIIRKSKIVLESNVNEKNKVTFTINIESNHINNQLDNILQNIENIINLSNYNNVNNIEKKDKVQSKLKKNKFVDGSFV